MVPAGVKVNRMRMTRRAALAGAVAMGAAPALAQSAAPAWSAMPAFDVWRHGGATRRLPLASTVDTPSGPKLLGDWLDGRPSVLVLWATWCGPCLAEKPAQAALQRRLNAARSRTQILALQAFDRASFAMARATLQRLGATALPAARASTEAETAFRSIFGASRVDSRRISLPSLLLVGADGQELGRAVGALTVPGTERSYWEDQATFDFLLRLGAARSA